MKNNHNEKQGGQERGRYDASIFKLFALKIGSAIEDVAIRSCFNPKRGEVISHGIPKWIQSEKQPI
jgi:hypothetical protein